MHEQGETWLQRFNRLHGRAFAVFLFWMDKGRMSEADRMIVRWWDWWEVNQNGRRRIPMDILQKIYEIMRDE